MTLLGWVALGVSAIAGVLGPMLHRERRLHRESRAREAAARKEAAAEKARANEYQAAATEAREVLRAVRDRHDADVAAIDDEIDAVEDLADEPGALADALNAEFGNPK